MSSTTESAVRQLPNLAIVDGPEKVLELQLADREINRLKVVVTGNNEPGVAYLLTSVEEISVNRALPLA